MRRKSSPGQFLSQNVTDIVVKALHALHRTAMTVSKKISEGGGGGGGRGNLAKLTVEIRTKQTDQLL